MKNQGICKSIYLIFLIYFVSCVPTKKVVYLQGEDTLDGNMPRNEIISSFKVDDFKYTLSSTDIISIDISSLTPDPNGLLNNQTIRSGGVDPTLSGYTIDEKGFVNLPLIGDLKLDGLTVKEAEKKLIRVYSPIIKSPSVSIRLLTFHFTVLGEVGAPGKYTTYDGEINLLESLGEAGGITEYGDKSAIQIVRIDNNKADVVYVNVLEDSFLSSPYFYLQPNDIITVAPLKVKNRRRYSLANYGLILSTITVAYLLFTR